MPRIVPLDGAHRERFDAIGIEARMSVTPRYIHVHLDPGSIADVLEANGYDPDECTGKTLLTKGFTFIAPKTREMS